MVPSASGISLNKLHKLIKRLQYSTVGIVASYCGQCGPAGTVALSAAQVDSTRAVYVGYVCGCTRAVRHAHAHATRSVHYRSRSPTAKCSVCANEVSVCQSVCLCVRGLPLAHEGVAVTSSDSVRGAAWLQARRLAPQGHPYSWRQVRSANWPAARSIAQRGYVCRASYVRGAAWPQDRPPHVHGATKVKVNLYTAAAGGGRTTVLLWPLLRHSDCRETSLPPFGGRPGVRNARVHLSPLSRSPLDTCLSLSLRTQLPLMYSQLPSKNYHHPRSKPLHTARQSSLGPLPRLSCAHPFGPRLPFLAPDCDSGPARALFFGQPSSKRNAARFASPCRASTILARPLSCTMCIPGYWAYSTPKITVLLRPVQAAHPTVRERSETDGSPQVYPQFPLCFLDTIPNCASRLPYTSDVRGP